RKASSMAQDMVWSVKTEKKWLWCIVMTICLMGKFAAWCGDALSMGAATKAEFLFVTSLSLRSKELL
ncbi:hypothetical protein ABG067_008005, partial [Albugo candida]